MDHLVPLSDWKKYIFRLDAASSVDVEKMKKQLVEMGYERVGQVEGSGQFAVRGGIIDIYPLTEENPVRIELWGDEVDSIRSFDVESQRSIENLDAITVYPAAEVIVDKQRAEAGILKMEKEVKKLRRQLRDENKTEEAHHLSELLEECREKLEEYGVGAGLDSYVDYFYDRTVSFLDYFTDRDTLVVLDEPNRISQEGDAIEQEFRESMMNRLEKGYVLPGQTGILYSSQEVTGRLNAMRCMGLCTLEAAKGSFRITDRYSIFVKSVNPYNNSFELLVKDLKRFKKEGYQVILLSGSRTRAKRLAEDLREYELNSFYTDDMERVVQPGEILAAYGNARKGYEYPLIKFVVISESDIFGKEKKKKKRKVYEGKKIQSFSELAVGDYVVHENHGLGVYKGIEKIEVDKVTKDYMKM